MLYFTIRHPELGEETTVVDVTPDHGQAISHEGCVVIDRNYFKSIVAAEEYAAASNAWAERSGLPNRYTHVDRTANVSPRYDVVSIPRVGEPVSYAFNGDSYPCGKVTKVAASLRRVEAREEDGSVHVFWRRDLSASWIKDGTWSLVHGHVSSYNREF